MHHVTRPRTARLGATAVTLGVVGALGVAGALSASAATGTAAEPSPAPVCTGYDTDGFTIFVQHDVDLGNSETEGSLALGGDLTLPTDTNLIHSSGLTPDGYALPVVDGDPTRLLVGGTLDLASTGSLQVTSHNGVTGTIAPDQLGAIKVGETAGLTLAPRSGVDRLHAAATDENTRPWIDVSSDANQTFDGDHAVTYPAAASVVDSRFPTLAAQGEALRSVGGDDAATATLDANGSDGVITLTEGRLNVLTVDAATLGRLASLTFADVAPGADTQLVVDVTGIAGDVRTPPLRGAGMPGNPTADDPNPWAPYVTWNLTGAGAATVTGELITGTILAPDVDLTTDASSRIEGQVIAKSLVTRGGEIHQYASASSCATPTPTPSPTESTATPTPSPTQSTATPTPSPTHSTSTPTPSQTTTSPAPVVPTTTTTPTTQVLGTGGTASPSGGASATGPLATTGASLVGPFVAGLALVAAGVVLLVVRRRVARG
ncbi:collagen-binding domain-containing protein [Luteimicrobium sp. DT211]|uniref:collagen-binding domain-containing protein n=1 Tax=Luteimicrobium sp. DT211 TaxID=3393412 RepID=UPI003CF0C04B